MSENNNVKKIDSRVILMGRSQKSPSTSVSEVKNCWLTLGHFDWAKIEKIEPIEQGNSPTAVDLSAIWDNNCHLSFSEGKDDIHWHPIYVIREFDSEEVPKNFWDQKASFMLICQVRSKWTAPTDRKTRQENFENAVDNCVLGCIVDPQAPLGKNSCFIRYRTLALSDIVLILKSDSLHSLMDILEKIQSLSCIGDLYSYCCINPRVFEPNSKLTVEDDVISLMSIRFSIRDAEKCWLYLNLATNMLEEVKKRFPMPPMTVEQPCFVTGTEDINLQIKNLSSKQLCESLQCLLLYHERLWDAFDDMVTRLGIPAMIPVKRENKSFCCDTKVDQLEGTYEKLLERFQNTMKDSEFPITKYDWVRPIAELLKGMKNISKNNLLRQFCFVMLGGIVGIVDKCEEIVVDWKKLGNKNNIPENTKKAIHDKLTFVMRLTSRLANLMENMVRMEGELVHHPETRPLLFFIPANLLEFYMSFTDRCIRYYYSRENEQLQPGENSKRKFFPLLVVPELCETIHIEIQPDESKPFLLNVLVPIHMLYHPFAVICSLVHEITHCAGEECRCREERFCLLIRITAYLLLELLGLDKNKPIALIEETAIILERLYPKDPDKRHYMRYIEKNLSSCFYYFLGNNSILQYLWEINLGFSYHSLEEEQQKIARCLQDNWDVQIERILSGTLEQSIVLFRECYADLGMVSLLSLQPEEYLKLFQDYDRTSGSEYLSGEGYKVMLARITLVICAMASDSSSPFYEWICRKDRENSNTELVISVRNYCRWLLDLSDQSVDEENANRYPRYIMLLILKYLEDCKIKMDKLDNNEASSKQIENIRKDFCCFARRQEFASDKFFRTLENHRPLLYDWANDQQTAQN